MAESQDIKALQQTVERLETLVKEELERQEDVRKLEEEQRPEVEKEKAKAIKDSTEFRNAVRRSLDDVGNTLKQPTENADSSDLTSSVHQLLTLQKEQNTLLENQYQAQLTILSLIIVVICFGVLWNFGKMVATGFRNIY